MEGWVAPAPGPDRAGRRGQGRKSAPPVGRREELAILRAEARRAFAGELRVVVVEGGPGIGKTTLVGEVASHLGSAACVRAACAEAESHLPWGVVGLLLSELCSGVFSDLGRPRRPSPLRPPEPSTDPLATGAELTSRLEALASEGPTVLVLEDLHWSDPPSAAALLFALRRLVARPIFTVATVRPPFPGSLGEGWRRLVVARGRRVRLGGMSTEELVKLADTLGHAVSARAAARIVRHTGGHPMWAAALFSNLTPAELERGELLSRIPVDIAGTISARSTRLSDEARALVAAGAVLGQRFAVATVTALAGLDDPAPALQEAVDSGLVCMLTSPPDTGSVLGFRHTVVQSAVYQGLGPAHRAQLHARAAHLTSGGEALRHLAAATLGPTEPVAAELEAAGDEACTAWQLPLAQLALDAAVRSSPPGADRARRLLSAMEAHLAAGDPVRARVHVAEVSALGPEPRRDYVLGRLARCEGRTAEARAHLERSWEGLEGHDVAGAELRAKVAAELASLALARMSAEAATGFAREAIAASTPGTPTWHLAGALELVGLALGGHGHAALELAGPDPPQATPLQLLFGRGVAKLWTDDLQGAHEDLSVAVERLEAGGVAGQMSPRAFLSEACFRLGRVAEASGHAELACEIVDAAERFWDCVVVHVRAGYAAAAMGDFSAAEAHAAAIGSMAARNVRRTGGLWRVEAPTGTAATVEVAIAIARGDAAALAETSERVARLDVAAEPGTFAFGPVLAEGLAVTGHLEEAEAALEAYERRARAVCRRSSLAGVARVRGTIASARGDVPGMKDAFDDAVRQAAGLPFELGRCRLAYGKALARVGERGAARAQLDEARATFSGGGALAFVRIADDELKAIGGHLQPSGALPLTPAEEAIARLAAQRLSNPEIATRLVISRRTVEYHLTHVYAKLGVRGRAELARLAERSATPS